MICKRVTYVETLLEVRTSFLYIIRSQTEPNEAGVVLGGDRGWRWHPPDSSRLHSCL